MTVNNVTGDSTSDGRDLLREHTGDKNNPHKVMHDQLPDVTHSQHHNRLVYEPDYLEGPVWLIGTMVANSEYIAISNADTDEPAFPTEIGGVQDLYPDVPPWTTDSFTGLVQSGWEGTFTKSGKIRSLEVYFPTLGVDDHYSLVIITDPNGAVPSARRIVLDNASHSLDEWNTIEVGDTLFLAGTEVRLYLESQNFGATTQVTGGWRKDGNGNNTDPNTSGWNHNRNNANETRIDKTDLDAVDRSTELAGIIEGSTILFVETADPDNFVELLVTAPPTDNGTFIEYETDVNSEAGSLPDGTICTMTAEIPIAQPTAYLQELSKWTNDPPDWITMTGYLTEDNLPIAATTTGFSVNVTFQELSQSADWNLILLGSGGGGGGDFVADLFVGAGSSGYVPDPLTESGRILGDDGTWVLPNGAGQPPNMGQYTTSTLLQYTDADTVPARVVFDVTDLERGNIASIIQSNGDGTFTVLQDAPTILVSLQVRFATADTVNSRCRVFLDGVQVNALRLFGYTTSPAGSQTTWGVSAVLNMTAGEVYEVLLDTTDSENPTFLTAINSGVPFLTFTDLSGVKGDPGVPNAAARVLQHNSDSTQDITAGVNVLLGFEKYSNASDFLTYDAATGIFTFIADRKQVMISYKATPNITGRTETRSTARHIIKRNGGDFNSSQSFSYHRGSGGNDSSTAGGELVADFVAGDTIALFSTRFAGGDSLEIISNRAVITFVELLAGKGENGDPGPAGTSGTGQAKNLLMNGDFLLWQRGVSFNTGQEYTADRWRINADMNADRFEVGNAAFPESRIQLTSDIDRDLIMSQPVELNYVGRPNNDMQVGKQLTISCNSFAQVGAPVEVRAVYRDAAGDSTNQVEILPSTVIGTGDQTHQQLSHTFTVNLLPAATNTCLEVFFTSANATAGQTGYFGKCQLEKGVTASAFEEVSLAEEVNRCERYYQKLYGVHFGFGYSQSGFFVRGGIIYPTKMRIAPAAILTYLSSAGFDTSSLTFVSASDSSVAVGMSSNTTVNGAFFEINIELDAEF